MKFKKKNSSPVRTQRRRFFHFKVPIFILRKKPFKLINISEAHNGIGYRSACEIKRIMETQWVQLGTPFFTLAFLVEKIRTQSAVQIFPIRKEFVIEGGINL